MTPFTVREAVSADAPGIRRLFARVFGRELTDEEWTWKFERNPDGWFGVVAVLEDEIVGNYSGCGVRLLVDGRQAPSFAVGDVATDPRVRGLGGRQGVFRSMAELFYRRIEGLGIPFCFGFPGGRHLSLSHRVVKSRTLFAVREIHAPCDSFPPPPAGLVTGDWVGEGFDPLWSAASRFLSYAAVRDRARVNWRFHARPSRYYRMVWLEGPTGTTGWSVLSIDGESALVADFLGSDPDGGDLTALFSGAAAEARRFGAKRLVFWETPGGPAREVLARLPGERRDAGFPIIVRTFDDDAADRFAAGVHLTPALYDMV
ncbi:MAG TPA: GNAT family N-acetyltransferase [Thermoanaerobaculia bacterium]|nr:GNAT family N-acetyltransferase [Thermoanaerobaculia bacterium]